MITVWGRRNSVNVQKVLWALEELDVPYTRENAGGSFGGNKDADFLAMNPMGLVPVIRDGDVTMFESNAIVRWLAARYRDGLLRPKDPKGLAMAEQWMEWAQVNVGPAVGTLQMNLVRSPPEKRDHAAVAAATERTRELVNIADQWIARHDWFAGRDFSFADIVMGALFWRYTGFDIARPVTPHLDEWLDALQLRDPFRRAVMAVPRAKYLADWNRIEMETG
ncbi:MAG: glutathione S-transferase family protein [Aestuariivirga sp.]|uniref:glutathione S-transferase family protein n=1 Tax=Aestuariivirga sp. TaxID=2650926 RepID=UPI0025BB3CD1|nr:glutathione S-transferase family protein [Aestuariivirga sp.]MCA3560648.1 glutathione S-transferase family protein [Aestuariivirga sp.]